jgi:hypothetical protein
MDKLRYMMTKEWTGRADEGMRGQIKRWMSKRRDE